MSAVAHRAELVPSGMERRCFGCGARVTGKSCEDCGKKVEPRVAIGSVHGVGVNFGNVQNIYNITPSDPEIVDLRDVQDGLNERFPERIPPAGTNVPEVRALPSRVPSGLVRTVNFSSYVWAVVLAATLVSFFGYLLK